MRDSTLAVRDLQRLLILAALEACSTERESEPPRRELSVTPTVERIATPAETRAPVEPPEPHVRPAEPSHALEGSASDEIARAIEPVEAAAEAAVTVERGTTVYVLYRYFGVPVARDRIVTMPDGELRLEAIEEAIDACADEGDYGMYTCAVAASPDPYLAAALLAGDDVHGWGVAALERNGTSYRARAKRMLFALSRDEGTVGERSPELRVRDPDADGEDELIVTLPIVTVRDDNTMTGTDEGIVAYVLEAHTLRTQFRVTSEWYSSNVDVGGTIRTCRAGWRFTDLDEDGHDDITVRARCTNTIVDEHEDEESRFSMTPHDCLWKAEIDAWTCPPSESWLFIDGLAADTPEALAASQPNLGQNVEAIVESARRELDAEDEGDEPSSEAGVEPASEPAACDHVVDDPAPPLRIRAAPSARSAIAGELPNGSRVRLRESRGRWARIEAPAAGWIWTEHLTRDCD